MVFAYFAIKIRAKMAPEIRQSRLRFGWGYHDLDVFQCPFALSCLHILHICPCPVPHKGKNMGQKISQQEYIYDKNNGLQGVGYPVLPVEEERPYRHLGTATFTAY